jgi:hypothetical protein
MARLSDLFPASNPRLFFLDPRLVPFCHLPQARTRFEMPDRDRTLPPPVPQSRGMPRSGARLPLVVDGRGVREGPLRSVRQPKHAVLVRERNRCVALGKWLEGTDSVVIVHSDRRCGVRSGGAPRRERASSRVQPAASRSMTVAEFFADHTTQVNRSGETLGMTCVRAQRSDYLSSLQSR